MPRKRSSVLAILATALAAILLASCIQIQVESDFRSDGSGRHSISSSFDRALLDDPMLGGEIENELDFDEIEREAEAAGLETERIDDADRLGIRVSMEVDDNEDLGDVLAQLFSSMDGDAPPAGGFSGGFTQSGSGIGGTTYRFELTVDGDVLFDEGQDELDGDLEDEFDMDFGMDMMRQFINLTYAVSMPGEITDHNGTEIGPGRVQWELPLQGTATFIAESEEGSTFSLALIIGAGIGVIALGLIVIGAFVLLRGQRTPTAATSGPTQPAEHPVHPVTGQPDPVTEVERPQDRNPDQPPR